MKYIIFEDQKSGLLQPVIFGEHTTHSQVTIEGAKPVSAGFVNFDKKGLSVFGESDSLNLGINERDRDLIGKVFFNYGTAYFIQPNWIKPELLKKE